MRKGKVQREDSGWRAGGKAWGTSLPEVSGVVRTAVLQATGHVDKNVGQIRAGSENGFGRGLGSPELLLLPDSGRSGSEPPNLFRALTPVALKG